MVSASPRKTAAKKGRSPAKERRNQTRAQNAQALLSASNSPNKLETLRTTRYSHHLPTEEQRKANGRVPGRNLIRWNRPRMTEKLMLHLHYECSRHKIQLPWDAIAHRLHPGSSGAAVVQHINRLRRELVAEGHMVPPLSQKSSSNINPDIRGYVRQNVGGDDFETTRPVAFDEGIEDPRFNLPGDFNIPDDEEFVEPMMDMQQSSPSVGSEHEYRCQDSPTPKGRTLFKSSHGSEESFSPLPPQFVSPAEVVHDTRRLSPDQLQHLHREAYDMNLNHGYGGGRHSPLGSEAGTSPIERTASPNQSFKTNDPNADRAEHAHVPFPNAHGYLNGYRMAAVHGWAHPYMYQMGVPQSMHPSMHMEMPPQYSPYVALDPSVMKQTHGHAVSMIADRKGRGLQVEPSTEHGARIGSPFIGLTDPALTKPAVPTCFTTDGGIGN